MPAVTSVNASDRDPAVYRALVRPAGARFVEAIDQRALPLSSSYRYDGVASTVTAYIVDTGIRATHAEFRTAAGAAM